MGNANKQRRLIPAMLCIMLMLIIGMSVQIFATDVSTWDALKTAMNAPGTDTIKLTGSIEKLNSTEELVVNGTKTLDLNGKNLTIETIRTDDELNCIYLSEGATLTIKDSQYTSSSANKLYVENTSNSSSGDNKKAGINPVNGTLIIESGNVEAHGGRYAAGIGGGDYNYAGSGIIVINGGKVNAYGGYDGGAGIGGGWNGSGVEITITGGVVNATGGSYGAGIGGGDSGDGGIITITGGVVNATGGSYAAGIGGGDGGDGGETRITGGTVNATGGGGRKYYSDNYYSYYDSGAGIGGGAYGNGGVITITGGTVNATGGDGYYYYDSYYEEIHYRAVAGAGIGGGAYGESGVITIVGGYVTANAGDETEIEEYAPTVNSAALSADEIQEEEYEPHSAAGIGYGASDYYGGGDYESFALSTEDEASNSITIGGGTVIAKGGVAFSEAPTITASEYKYKTNENDKTAPKGDYIKSSTAPYKYNANQKYVEIVCGGEDPIQTGSLEYLRWALANQEYVIRVFTDTNGGEISLEGLKNDIPEDGKTTHKPHSNATFIITPDEGYKISKIVIDGKEADLASRNVKKNDDNSIEYTFKDITESHKMVVWFEKIPAETP